MNLDVEFLISFFDKLSAKGNNEELGEQEAEPSSGGSTGKGVPKWADVFGGPKRDKANRLGKQGEKWETGMNRGVANQIW